MELYNIFILDVQLDSHSFDSLPYATVKMWAYLYSDNQYYFLNCSLT